MTGMLPGDERFRNLPRTSFGMDPRGIPAHDIDAALEGARFGLPTPDYFGDGPRYSMSSQLPPRSPFPGGGARFDDMAGYSHEMGLNEMVRKTNLAVALANHNVSHRAQYTQIHPMMCSDGRLPADFQVPKTLESMKLLDNTQLDRILQSYRLPFDNRTILTMTSAGARGGEPLSPSRLRQAKLQILFEHLGAHRITEHEKMKKAILYREV